MEKTFTGTIRKLIVGADPLNAMAFEVGKTFNTPGGILKVTEILEDQSAFYFFGNIRYLIYVETPDKKTCVWKFFERMPVSVECVV
jgi:hypothetical protein